MTTSRCIHRQPKCNTLDTLDPVYSKGLQSNNENSLNEMALIETLYFFTCGLTKFDIDLPVC